jgi:hypothetical protein
LHLAVVESPRVPLSLPTCCANAGAVKMSQERPRKISIKLRVVRPPAGACGYDAEVIRKFGEETRAVKIFETLRDNIDAIPLSLIKETEELRDA